MSAADTVHLRRDGVSVVLEASDGRLPSVVHWGQQIAETDVAAVVASASAPVVHGMEQVRLSVLPEHHEGWVGKLGLTGHRGGRDWSPRFTVTSREVNDFSARFSAADETAALLLELEIELLAGGLLRARATLTNTSDSEYQLDGLVLAFPVPATASELLDFAGRWGTERAPQRQPFSVGVHERTSRRGRPGADSAFILSAGVPGFSFRAGSVRGVHLGFSGNQVHYAERMASGVQVIGGGELLLPGEVSLGRDERYSSPWLYGAYGEGLDDQAHRFHSYLRSRPQHPSSPRPVTLNVWEAVYFDHRLDRLTELAESAVAIGVERFVLDDGWFRNRRDDTAGLGDWFVDETVWPAGLHPLTRRVKDLGMQFGLWVEPEMINEDSDLARQHPEWIMATGGRLPRPERNQQVLDLGNPDTCEYLFERISALIDEYDIDYLKWDHNRELIEAGHAPHGEAGVHQQTLALYALLARLRERFPAIEIESCSSGGARVDLGILQLTDRVWSSDCIDPLERAGINRWTEQLLPPELVGSHVASPTSHTTGRSHSLSFRAASSFFEHFGIEWDVSSIAADEVAELSAWVASYKAHRELFHTGSVVRADAAPTNPMVTGIVAADGGQAIYRLSYLARGVTAPAGRIALPGLDSDRRYRVEPLRVGGAVPGLSEPDWFAEGVVLSGAALAALGVQAPDCWPEQAVLLSAQRVD